MVVGVVLLVSSAFMIWMYTQINQDRTQGHEKSAEIARQQTSLSEISEVSVYHGGMTVHIVAGMTEDDKEGLVYINPDEEKVIDQVIGEKTISTQDMKNIWEQNCSDCEFINIQFAYEENHPVYEVTYIDDQQRYVLDYYKLTGEPFNQRFAFKQNE